MKRDPVETPASRHGQTKPSEWAVSFSGSVGKSITPPPQKEMPEAVRETTKNFGAESRDRGFSIVTPPENSAPPPDQLLFWPDPPMDGKRGRTWPFFYLGGGEAACVYKEADGLLFQGDSVAWLKTLPEASVDLLFADPPYNIGKAEWDSFSTQEEYLQWCEEWVREAARVLTDRGTCYICGFSEILADVKYRTAHFFKGCRWIVWHYRNKANLGNDWGRSHESILHYRKSPVIELHVDDIRIPYSAHTLRYPCHPQAESSAYGNGRKSVPVQWRPDSRGAKPKDVFDLPTTCNGMGEKTPHPTQKPEALLRKLILAASNAGDVVLDPFSGSGTTLVVAKQLHRKWIGCERSAEYNGWAIERLKNVPDKPVQYWIDYDREVQARRESIR